MYFKFRVWKKNRTAAYTELSFLKKKENEYQQKEETNQSQTIMASFQREDLSHSIDC